VAQARAMYRAIARGHTGPDAQKFIYKFLETYNEETDAALAAVRDEAMESMTSAMKDPDCFQLDYLTQLKAIQQLKDTPQFKLFEIFVRGTTQELKDFSMKQESVVTDMGLDMSQAIRKLKFLTLVSLCSGKKEVSYEEIRRVVNIEASELELFIIDAIGTKVIEAKMDQMRQVLIVQYVMQRSFTMKDWDTIEEKLTRFRAGLIEVISLRKRKL